MTAATAERFRMPRYFRVASILSIIAAAALLAFLYRQVAIGSIIDLGEQNNLVLAKAAVNSVRERLVEYLSTLAGADADTIRNHRLTTGLAAAIDRLMEDTTVVRIKIYNRQGTVVFSTRPEQIGRDQSDNRGVIGAVAGRVASKLIYRDTFNTFDRETEEDNLVQSYVPVRRSATDPVMGVLEIYTNVQPLVDQAERAQFGVIGGVVLILSVLSAVLGLIVRRAEGIIEDQQGTIRERTRTLELLSSQMLASEEDEKRRIAVELHEGIAQTLSAVKVHIENACLPAARQIVGAPSTPLDDIVPLLRDAIQEVRTMAIDLRPSSLDDLGLLVTLRGSFRQWRSIYPGLTIESGLEVEEGALPAPLKIILYRVVQDVLGEVTRRARDGVVVRFDLQSTPEATQLLAGVHGAPCDPGAVEAVGDAPVSGLALMKERVILSGGEFVLEPRGATDMVCRATWHR